MKKKDLKATLEAIANDFASLDYNYLSTLEKNILDRATKALSWQWDVDANTTEVRLVRRERGAN